MFTRQDSQVLDRILQARHICRSFSSQIPSKEDVAAVIEAGKSAPYAIASAHDVEPFRHFFVLFQGNPLLPEIHRLIREESAAEAQYLRKKMEIDPFMAKYAGGLETMRRHTAEHGLPVFPDPPCFIVLAEWRGARQAEKQDLAHTLQNMWLKATVLNLDFNMISLVENMVDNQAFCKLFGLSPGKYGFHSCVLGYRKQAHLTSTPASAQVHWL